MGQSSSSGNGLCLKPACLHTASHVIQNLAGNWEQLDPCTNFHQMACGGAFERWKDDSRTGGNLVQDRVNRILRKVIESPYEEAVAYHSIMIRSNIDQENHGMLQRDYQSCMATKKQLAAGATPLIKVLTGLAEVWPINPDDNTTTVDKSEYEGLNKAIIHLEKLGVSSLRTVGGEAGGVAFPFISDPDLVMPTMIPEIGTHKNQSVYQDPDALKVYAGHIAKAFSAGLYATNISESQAQIIARDVVSLETRLFEAASIANMEWQAQMGPGMNFVKMTFDDLASLAPALGLDKIVSFFVPPDHKGEQVIMTHPSYFANASVIIEATSKTTLQSWLAWKTIVSLAEDVFDAELFTQTTVREAIGRPPRYNKGKEQWEKCIAHTTESLGWIMSRFFVSAAYTQGMKELAAKVSINVQGALIKRFSDLDWMTDEVKTRAIDKANKIQHNIGFPTSPSLDLHSPNSLAAYYKGLTITDDYFSNVLAARLNTLRTEYATIGKPLDRTSFPKPIHEVNAYYYKLGNSINMNAALSSPALFHPDLPSYATYGNLGTAVGHEFTHGFDNSGHKWDERGAAKGWFDNATTAAYDERVKCFVDQFNAYEVPITGGKMGNVDGKTTLDENLSDAGGLRIAFDAWKALRGDEKNGQNLPGLENFTHEQLFYLFFANGFCETLSPAYVEDLLKTDDHAPEMARIIGGAANSRGFREAWGCKVKEPTCEMF